MNEFDDLTNESFNEHLQNYFKNNDSYNHFEFALELARESTGFGSVFELFETGDLMEYTGFETDMDLDFDHDDFLATETADKYVSDLDDGLATLNLKTLPYFEEFYYDFLEVTGWEGSKEDFENNLRRSVDFFQFLTSATTEE
jgi:hypothetical protein